MMTLFFHLVLIFLISFNSSLADWNFFSEDDAPFFQDFPDEDIFNADANFFASLPEENRQNFDSSSCPIDENESVFLNARGLSCPNSISPPTPFTIPTLPGFTDIENAIEQKPDAPNEPEKNRPTGPYLVIQVPYQEDLAANERNITVTYISLHIHLLLPSKCPSAVQEIQGDGPANVDFRMQQFLVADYVSPSKHFVLFKLTHRR